MSYSRNVAEELYALKREVGHALKASAGEWRTISRARALLPKQGEFFLPEMPMNHPAFVPVRNTSLPRSFRYIRLERARDHDHPEGDNETAYIMIAPLDGQSRIDVDTWRKHKEACRVVRKRPDGEDSLGHLVHSVGGGWRFRYDVSHNTPDESGYHFGGEQFEPGEYLSIREADGVNIYRVVSVMPL